LLYCIFQFTLVLPGELAEAGLIKPVIDRTISLEEVPEVRRYVEEGHKKGNIIVAVAD
jgi:NADPH:quinone reductase-like Zn-dependent oxidoreductase